MYGMHIALPPTLAIPTLGNFIAKNFLNRNALSDIGDMRRQFFELLIQIGFVRTKTTSTRDVDVQTSEFNSNSKKEEIVTAVVCAGLYPNVAHAAYYYTSVVRQR